MRSLTSRIHDKEIKKLRKEGKLRPLGMTTRNYGKFKIGLSKKIKAMEIEQIEIKRKSEPQKAYLSENGSLLPNKWLSVSKGSDRETPLLDGTEYINEEGFRILRHK